MSDPIAVRVKSAYAHSAQALDRGLSKVGVAQAPPARDRRVAHWAFSLTKVWDSAALADLDVPWWTYRAIDEVDAWLRGRGGATRVFEYGSGASTLWLARRAELVVSVEHDRRFADATAATLADLPNVEFRVVEATPSSAPRIGSQKPGWERLDFSDYVGSIETPPANAPAGPYDLVVIDGRAREACLTAALGHLAADGLIVFDNTRRARYRRAIEAAPVDARRLPGLVPSLPYPDQTSLLTRRG